jgi:hypothetical protein
MKNKLQEVKISTIVYSVLIAIAALFIALAVAIYAFDYKNPAITKIESVIPFPAAVINGSNFIAISRMNSNTESVKHFYETQDFSKYGYRVDFTTSDGQKRLMIKEREVLNKLIEDKVIEILAIKNGTKITSRMVEQNVNRTLEQYKSTQDTTQYISRLYGWSTDDFKNKVVKPSMYSEELAKFFEKQDTSKEQAGQIINQAKSDLDKEKDFAAVAKMYSKGSTASQGGDLGWFSQSNLITELSAQVFAMKAGEISPVIESSLGFHIVKLNSKKTENGTDLVEISQIFYPKKTFEEWLGEQMKTMNIFIPLKDYYWDKNTNSVQFRSADLKNFEQKEKQDPKGDPSLMF